MTNITISLPEETVRLLRRTARERSGGRRGAISGLVKEALEAHIAALGTHRAALAFRAYDGPNLVAESESLDEIARTLEGRGVDPRGVRIVSSRPLRQVARAGLRGRRP